MTPTFIQGDPRSDFTPTTALTHIILLDDDIHASERIGAILSSYGFVVEARAWSKASMLAAYRPDILIIETLGHHDDAMALIAAYLDLADAPGIIIFSEIADESDRVVALELGADDFIVKPSSTRELVARIRALVRRRSRVAIANPLPPVYQVGTAYFSEWRYHLGSRLLSDTTGHSEVLSNAEHGVLATLLAARGGVVVREAFFDPAATYIESESLRSIDVRISRLRRRLHRHKEIIRTVRGRGYKLLPEVVIVTD